MRVHKPRAAHEVAGFTHASYVHPSAPTTFRGSAALASYLESANLVLRDLDGDGRLRADITQLPEMTLGRVSISPGTVVWPRDALSLDRVVIVIAPEDRFRIETEATMWHAPPCVSVLPPSDVPVTFCVRKPIDELFYVGASRAVIRDIDLAPGYDAGPVDQVDRGALAPLLSFIRSLSQTEITERSQQAIEPVAVEAVRSLLRLVVDPGDQGSSLFDRGTSVIERSYRDPRLSVADIASALRVSERTVHAAFAEAGTTVMRELRERRTRAALEIRDRAPEMTRHDLARAAGFGSISSMQRAMRERG